MQILAKYVLQLCDKLPSLGETLINLRSNQVTQRQLLHNFVVSNVLKFLTDGYKFTYVNKLKATQDGNKARCKVLPLNKRFPFVFL